MFTILANGFKVPDIRKKLLFVLLSFVIYSLGAHIPVPGINTDALSNLIGQGTLFGMMDMFVGGSLRRFSIFALGITPYINASIIFQLLQVVVPKLEELAKEGETGRKVLMQWTRYLTIGLAFFQAIGMLYMLSHSGGILPAQASALYSILVVFSLVGGTSFLMWLGEEITTKGVGNGVSLIIFIGIINSLPQQIFQTYKQADMNGRYLGLVLLILISIATIAFVIFIHLGQRKIPVQYAKRIIGRKVLQGQTTYLPMKVNTAGVIPIIFAISILMFPATIVNFVTNQSVQAMLAKFTNSSSILYNVIYFLLVFVFTFFYTAVVFNPKDVAERMKKHGGFILGIRPGKPTAEYLERIMVRITFIGALFLGLIAVLPSIMVLITGLSSFGLGGTSILIVIGVALDTINQIEAQLLMRHYEGF